MTSLIGFLNRANVRRDNQTTASSRSSRGLRALTALIALLTLVLAPTPPARAQPCPADWLPGDGIRGVTSSIATNVYAITPWDPDGDGPRTSVFVVGGQFSLAGNVNANGLAVWDPDTRRWSSIGSLASNSNFIRTILPLPSGELIVGGSFSSIDGVAATNVARFDGVSWSRLSVGLDNAVHSLALLPDGQIVAGGAFRRSGNSTLNGIARWNGTTWLPFANGLVGQAVRALAVLPSGDLVAAGSFSQSGGMDLLNIARWNGSAWLPLAAGLSHEVRALAVLPNGDLVAGGTFSASGTTSLLRVARWDGVAWSPIGSGLSFGDVSALAVLPNGDLIATGSFAQAGTASARAVARWDGSLWTGMGGGITTSSGINAVAPWPDHGFIVGGAFTRAGVVSALNVAAWDHDAWTPLGGGLDGFVFDLAELPNGDLIAAGSFVAADATPLSGVARRVGDSWIPLANLIDPQSTNAGYSLQTMPNGDLILGGSFTAVDNIPANNIARWDGAAWHPLGTGTAGDPFADVFALAVLPNGDLVAGGFFTSAGGVTANHIARWDGVQWRPLGAGLNGLVFALAVLPNGDLIAGGQFTAAGGAPATRIARWDGSQWHPLGSGVTGGASPDVMSLAVLPDGQLAVGGFFTTAGGLTVNRIARWNPATNTWSTFGPGSGMNAEVFALQVLPGGDLLAAGNFNQVNGAPINFVARWHEEHGVGSWYPGGPGTDNIVRAILVRSNGSVALGGHFNAAGGNISTRVAHFIPGAPPAIVTDPQDVRACAAAPAAFSAAAENQSELFWQLEDPAAPNQWITLAADPSPLPGGGAAAATPPDASSVSIRVIARSDHFRIRFVASNDCGTTASNPATLTVCRADFTCDQTINSQDFFDFLSAFFMLSPACDYTADGVIDSRDFFEFLDALYAGC